MFLGVVCETGVQTRCSYKPCANHAPPPGATQMSGYRKRPREGELDSTDDVEVSATTAAVVEEALAEEKAAKKAKVNPSPSTA